MIITVYICFYFLLILRFRMAYKFIFSEKMNL